MTYKREEHKHRINTRRLLWERQEGVCAYCNRKIPYEKASLDHIIPVILLEENIGDDNLVMTCKYCNLNKQDHIVYTNLYDRVVYPILDIPVIFRWEYIIRNIKDKNNVRKKTKND